VPTRMRAASDLDRSATWPRPVPLVGDRTSAAERAANPAAGAFSTSDADALHRIIAARRDVRRFRPDPVPAPVLRRILAAAHAAPSVGHSQPWRFVIVREPATRERAAWLADQARLAQAATMPEDDARQLLDLQLDGIREAPVGVVVCCDRRAEPDGVLGRATFQDADVWSCACAIENLWLAARADGLGVGWVTLFAPEDLGALVHLPPGVDTLGWLCVGYPDERQPGPGLERAGWSQRAPLEDVVLQERWPDDAPEPPRSRVRAPHPDAVVEARDERDQLLTVPGSLGVLDGAIDRVVARCGADVDAATLVLVGADHPVADLGVTPYRRSVTADVLAAARAGTSIGASTAAATGAGIHVVDAGSATGDLAGSDAMDGDHVAELVARGRADGIRLAGSGLVALGEVGIGNTTVAATLAASLLGLTTEDAVGLGSGADTVMLGRKREVVSTALARHAARQPRGASGEPPELDLVASLGGPDVAYLVGIVLGTAEAGGVVVLDGLLTSVAALCACRMEPAVAAHLVAGQRSREVAHQRVLRMLGLEPLLDLRLRSGEGVGAVLACRLLLDGLRARRTTARVDAVPRLVAVPTTNSHDQPDDRSGATLT
jgi:nicotinate-nucleotide--dimethylbenzimidazole phosphoribosyltransferase